jgi:hypothetical protein
MRIVAAALLLLMAAAAAAAPGTGWSRASDLSVYGSMHVFARTALDQEMLCAGVAPARASSRWERAYGWRQQAVTAALTQRYGTAALARAQAAWAPPVACGDVTDPQWRSRYEQLLRLLEIRFRLTGERRR